MVSPHESLPPLVEQETIEGLLLLIDVKVGNYLPLSDGQRFGAFTSRDVSGQRYWLGLHQIPLQSSRFGETALIHTIPKRYGVPASDKVKHYYFFSNKTGLQIQEFNLLDAKDALDDFETDDVMNSDDQIRAITKHLQGKQLDAMIRENSVGLGEMYESDAQTLMRLVAESKPYKLPRFPILHNLLHR